MKEKCAAIVLSAGRGTRMKSETAKQYLLIKGKPVIWYSLQAFENCPFIDEVILVTGAEDVDYCKKEIAEKYGFAKITQITAGGKERYHSVYNGLKAVKDCDFVYIHDGARPFITQEILKRAHEAAHLYRACAVAMPVKDTIRISDDNGFGAHTPPRSLVWQIQTPQVFSHPLIRRAYDKLMEELEKGSKLAVTDDAMVIEHVTQEKVKLVEGAYFNLKITTPEDLKIAEIFVDILGEW